MNAFGLQMTHIISKIHFSLVVSERRIKQVGFKIEQNIFHTKTLRYFMNTKMKNTRLGLSLNKDVH